MYTVGAERQSKERKRGIGYTCAKEGIAFIFITWDSQDWTCTHGTCVVIPPGSKALSKFNANDRLLRWINKYITQYNIHIIYTNTKIGNKPNALLFYYTITHFRLLLYLSQILLSTQLEAPGKHATESSDDKDIAYWISLSAISCGVFHLILQSVFRLLCVLSIESRNRICALLLLISGPNLLNLRCIHAALCTHFIQFIPPPHPSPLLSHPQPPP